MQRLIQLLLALLAFVLWFTPMYLLALIPVAVVLVLMFRQGPILTRTGRRQ